MWTDMDTPLRGVLLSNVSHLSPTPDKGEFVISVVGGVLAYYLKNHLTKVGKICTLSTSMELN